MNFFFVIVEDINLNSEKKYVATQFFLEVK